MRPEILLFFANFIEKELGIIYSEENYFQLENRLQEIIKLQGFSSAEALYAQATQSISGNLRQLLLDLATNNETFFFRDQRVFKSIETLLLKEFIERHGSNESLQIWSAASSTGQEAISLAILINEFNLQRSLPLDFAITGTDISERVLARARAGRYSPLEIQRGMPIPLLTKYFTQEDGENWLVRPDVRRSISFSKLNLMEPFPYINKFHLVLCRNVLIYQSVPSKIDIVKRIAKTMAPGGYLVLGAAESLVGLSEDFEQKMFDGAVFYQKKLGEQPE